MSDIRRTSIDLSCDLGEGGPHDAAIMPLVTSVNIACGGHAGDDATMAAAVAVARRHGVAIGAHPGHADRHHFGRRELPITPAAAAALVVGQVGRLAGVAGAPPRHLKLHGGLYHQVARDATLAVAVCDALGGYWPGMILVAPAGSRLVGVARDRGLAVAEEAFIDRAYRFDGSLVPRTDVGAVIDDPAVAAARAVEIATTGRIVTIDGRPIPLSADTLCLHGDAGDPVTLTKAVRAALGRAGIRLACPPHGANPSAAASDPMAMTP